MLLSLQVYLSKWVMETALCTLGYLLGTELEDGE